MRTIITGSGLIISLTLIILIHCSIIDLNLRHIEVSRSLDNAMDYSFDKLQDIYAADSLINLNEDEKEGITNNIMSYFCKCLQSQLTSNAELEVKLLYLDYTSGTMQIGVKEKFRFISGLAASYCSYEKTYSLY